MKKGKYEASRAWGRFCVIGLVLLLCIGLLSVLFYKKKGSPDAPAGSPTLHTPEATIPTETAAPASDFSFWSEHLPQRATYIGREDVYLICTDAVEMQQGSHYAAYSVEDGQLIPWENRAFSADLSVLGLTFHEEFNYGVRDGNVAITYVPVDYLGNGISFYYDTSQGIHRVLVGVRLTFPDGKYVHYPVYLDLETGEVTDFLGDMDQETVFEVFSREVQTMVRVGEETFLLGRQDDNSTFHYFYLDVAGQEIIDLEVLSGKEIENAVPIPDEIVCWNDAGEFWSLSLEDWSVTPLTSESHVVYQNGVFHNSRGWGSSFFLYQDEGQRLCLYDFLTRNGTVLAGPDGWQFDGRAYMPCGYGRMLCMPWQGKEDTYLLLDADTCALHPLEVSHPGTPYLHMWEKARPDELVFMSDNHMDYYFYKVR